MASSIPRNVISNPPYRGLDVFMLASQGYGSPYWLTFNQPKQLRAHVRQGNKSTLVSFWKFTDMLKANPRKTIINIVGTIFTVLDYSRKCGIRVPRIRFTDLVIRSERGKSRTPFFTPEQAQSVIRESREPYKTIFALAWSTGMRSWGVLGLTVDNLDFKRGLITPGRASR